MKTFFKYTFAAMAMLVTFAHSAPAALNAGADPMIFSVNVPEEWSATVVREDFENQSIFNFKGGSSQPVFLFSVARITEAQWLQLHGQLKNAQVLQNEGGFVYYIQKTEVSHIKGSANAEYQRVIAQLDQVIRTVQLNG
jgi:hypothetical protein